MVQALYPTRKNSKNSDAYVIKIFITGGLCALSFVIFLIALALFPWTAYKRHHAAYLDYCCAFWSQVGGTVTVMAVNATLIVLALKFSFEFNEHPDVEHDLLSTHYLGFTLIQRVGLTIFVLSKQPRDIFRFFNKRPDI